MDGQQLAWVIVICTTLLCFTIAGVVSTVMGREERIIEPPFADATPEVWLAYYQTVVACNVSVEKVKTNDV